MDAAQGHSDSLTSSKVGRGELALALSAFIGLCVAVSVKAPQLLEPDDYAYRASIVALSQGHLLLTNAQYLRLFAQLSVHGQPGIYQWVHLANGKWISQKNPGYPFFAVLFQLLHALRAAPLFYGALACGGLFYGARRWLGPWGGAYAVVLYCSAGDALIFAWRSTMPTFTDMSLIAAAAGLLLGALLSRESPPARRLVLGLLAFLALDGATFIRYTDVVLLICALVAVVALARACALTRGMILSWIGVVALYALGDAVLNHYLYGGYFSSGYSPGLVSFSTSAVAPNVERLPWPLLEGTPMIALAQGAVVWIVCRLVRARGTVLAARTRTDAVVALVLAVSWGALWALYATYTWTVGQTLGRVIAIHVVRFYMPALGLIALLAAWLLAQVPRWIA
ncbi:MAG: hypothetical protein WA359_10985, partial [Acidimicrobiales bacterium]